MKRILALVAGLALIFGLAACDYGSTKTYAETSVRTFGYEGEEVQLDVYVRNISSGTISFEIDVEDNIGRPNKVFNGLAPGSVKGFNFQNVNIDQEVDVWVRIFNASGTLEFHHFDDVQWED